MGTGNYLSLRGTPYLVSNEHVVRQAVGCHLGICRPTDDYVLCNKPDTDRSQASRRIPHEVGCRTAKPKPRGRRLLAVSILDIVPRHTNCCLARIPGSRQETRSDYRTEYAPHLVWRSSRDAGNSDVNSRSLACSSTHRRISIPTST